MYWEKVNSIAIVIVFNIGYLDFYYLCTYNRKLLGNKQVYFRIFLFFFLLLNRCIICLNRQKEVLLGYVIIWAIYKVLQIFYSKDQKGLQSLSTSPVWSIDKYTVTVWYLLYIIVGCKLLLLYDCIVEVSLRYTE